jgi:hypothetical protein
VLSEIAKTAFAVHERIRLSWAQTRAATGAGASRNAVVPKRWGTTASTGART